MSRWVSVIVFLSLGVLLVSCSSAKNAAQVIAPDNYVAQFENIEYLQGTAVSKGKVTAQAAVVISPQLDTNVQGKILISFC